MTNNKNKFSGVKVFYNDKRLKDIYPHATGWEMFKYKCYKAFKKLLRFTVLLAVLVGIIAIVRYAYPVTVYQIQEKEVVIDNLGPKIDELKGSLIKDIWDNERAGKEESDALITWDPNPKHKNVEIASIGTCQWKIPTLQESYLKHYGKQITRKEAVLLALDDDRCKEVMAKVIFTEPNGWQKWYNSGKKVGAEQRLAVIWELEK